MIDAQARQPPAGSISLDPRARAAVSDSRQAYSLLALLMLTFIFSFLNRVILGVLIKPIRADLSLTDTQFSLLFGLVFAAPYAIASLLSGRLADHCRRLSVLRGAILLWSVATVLSMSAQGFWHLAISRIGVAAGEAALLPCAYSLLGDRFPASQLGRVYSILIMGATLGTGLALVFGGVLYDTIAALPVYHLPVLGAVKPWQMTFLVAGGPGIALAFIIGALPEPARTLTGPADLPLSTRAAFSRFGRHWQAYVALVIGFALCAMSLQTAQIFGVQHFVRTFDMTLTEAGLRIGLPVAMLGPCGLWVGGWLNDHWRARGRADAAFLVGVVAAAGLILGTAPAMLAHDLRLAQAALLVFGFFSNFPFGAVASAMVSITPQHARGTITAVYTLFATVFGAGLAPFITAIIAQYGFASEASVGPSVAIVATASSVIAATLFLWARPYLRRASTTGLIC